MTSVLCSIGRLQNNSQEDKRQAWPEKAWLDMVCTDLRWEEMRSGNTEQGAEFQASGRKVGMCVLSLKEALIAESVWMEQAGVGTSCPWLTRPGGAQHLE